MRPLRIAAGGLVPVLAAGCAYGTATPSARQQVLDLVRDARQRTTALAAASADVTETVQSGTDPVAQGKGTATWEFPRGTGEMRLTVDGRTTVVAVRVKNTFYEGRSRQSLAGTGRDLVRVGGQNPGAMPQIQAPGLDPFQVTTLLDAASWPDCVVTAEPVVTLDTAGRSTDYQMAVDTARLAAHEPPADRAWLTQMSRQEGGAVVTVVATIDRGRLGTVSAQLPIPKPAALAKPAPGASALPTPQPMTVVVSERFGYTGRPAPIDVPS